jgi:hypothetical protein
MRLRQRSVLIEAIKPYFDGLLPFRDHFKKHDSCEQKRSIGLLRSDVETIGRILAGGDEAVRNNFITFAVLVDSGQSASPRFSAWLA